MDRTQFYNIATNNGVQELDFLSNNLTNFKPRYAVGYYRVSAKDVMRPDLICYKQYKTVKYWWLILMINGVMNPLMDLKPGMQLMIPNLIDIYEFYKKYAALRT